MWKIVHAMVLYSPATKGRKEHEFKAFRSKRVQPDIVTNTYLTLITYLPNY